MANARKTASGNWRVLIYDYTDKDGKRHYQSFTSDTKADAEFKAAQFKKQKKTRPADNGMTVRAAIEKYITLSAVLSPTTLAAYEKIKQYAFQPIMDKRVAVLTDADMQQAINQEAQRPNNRTGKPISAKTVKNEWGLLASALSTVSGRCYTVKLPQVQKHQKQYPDPQLVINAIVGTDIELPCLLAMWLSFSMSEIRGLTYGDIKDGYITINRVTVNAGGQEVTKDNAKVETRLRTHKIPPYLMRLINLSMAAEKSQNSIYKCLIEPRTRASLYSRWQTICRQNNLGNLSFHDLRHYSASIGMALNIPDKYLMERGGWKTDYVMKSVYQHTFSVGRVAADVAINSYMDGLIKNATAPCNSK